MMSSSKLEEEPYCKDLNTRHLYRERKSIGPQLKNHIHNQSMGLLGCISLPRSCGHVNVHGTPWKSSKPSLLRRSHRLYVSYRNG